MGATNVVARNQMQPVTIYALFLLSNGSQAAPCVKE